MTTFTMELSEVIESLYNNSMEEDDWIQPFESLTWNGQTYGKLPVLPNYDAIGLADYPIFDENYRKILNGKIIEEYWHQEICTETVENFVWILRKKMNQIMPLYNQLYDSTLTNYSALDTIRIHSVGSKNEEMEGTGTGTTTAQGTSKTGSRSIGSDFPQTMLAGDADYATNGSDVNGTATTNSSGSQTSGSTNNVNSDSDTLVTGYQGAASDLIVKYRASLLNIDRAILAELGDNEGCFMLVLNNGESYFASDYPGMRYYF